MDDFDEHEVLLGRLPFLNNYRTMCHAPDPAFRHILEEIRELRCAG
jgi:hypothetical protein